MLIFQFDIISGQNARDAISMNFRKIQVYLAILW